ncbi:replication protein RepA [Pseudochrobactrum asaccharolyticum]|uniref:RepA protein n=1 Tax=Pseudochrobactrum asaccharolyticum TaxID=354351 RepID=A0A366DFN2_9HYPH|nr:replication protein RepA [Pseudochrobactrum asaccharolyticum]RBO88775.1 RepA protein [Pseudochrobactrum asaccharolyticum]
MGETWIAEEQWLDEELSISPFDSIVANDNRRFRQINNLYATGLAMEAEAAKEAGTLGFMARAMVQATMPHSKVQGNEFTRTNGAYTLSMLAPARIGLPYGSIPRLLIGYLTTQAVQQKSREIVLGSSLSRFMAELGLTATGGRWGSIPRLREQMARLMACSISCTWESDYALSLENITIADSANLWWKPQTPDQSALWESTVTLSDKFFREVTENPIPIDLRALKALKRSPMALDVYVWLSYRLSFLRTKTSIPWAALQLQFGADYPLTLQGRRDFKKKFLQALAKVRLVYPEARLDADTYDLTLKPSRLHILR